MKALHLVRTGRLAWRDCESPQLEGPGEAIVRPLAVARCDLDAEILGGQAPFRGAALHFLRDRLPERLARGIFRNAPFKGPYAFGHECVAEVVEVGGDVRSLQVGQRVIVPFQISCGSCARCMVGLTASCTSVPALSMYGFGAFGGHQWGGVAADRVRVPFADAMLVALPESVSASAAASAGDNLVDGHRAVAGPLLQRPGSDVLVVGGGAQSVGLYAAGLARALGAGQVDYLDHDRGRLAVAERIGARVLEGPYTMRTRRYPITVDASSDVSGLEKALRATEPGGICTSVAIYYKPRTPVPLLAMYGSGVTFVTGRVNARHELPRALEVLATARFDAASVTTCLASWDDAPEAMLDRSAKVVIARD
ncbi:MAG: hypothetical protein JWN04_6569 [Myxococcaceae bacterium]|nr:hypothetical protein [Myxococcaceae bacterium]